MSKKVVSQNISLNMYHRAYENGARDALGWLLREMDKCKIHGENGEYIEIRKKLQNMIIRLNDKCIDEFYILIKEFGDFTN